ncbi:hypothetical protein BB8028_0009g01060 [Beauveria bassiana]|uniref:Sec20 C-terminal domain-containing protein n=1 Tax=Beauveria bassiana TaxID=176275 RepID=A0A2S7YP03_BEABA|nr:hypothetical protein BB8028_0009g01060 [Beauveria bassiana]
MSFAGLQERLTALHDSTGQLRTLVDRLAHLTFQPGAVPDVGTDDDEDGGVLGELSAEIAQLLKAGAEEQELLREEANYVRPDGHEKERLVEGVVRVGTELTKLRVAFRKARLQAKRNLVEVQKLERKLLLHSYSAPVPESEPLDENDEPAAAAAAAAATTTQQQIYPRHHQPRSIHQSRSGLSEEDQRTVGASSSVTASLRRAHDLVASELGRSEYAHQTLSESSAALRRLDDSYGSLDSMLGRSRELLGTLLRSQKSDTWYLQTAFYMLATTAAWLVFRRLLYGPLWWLVLLPLRILFSVGSTATRAVLAKGRAPADVVKEGSVGGGGGTEDKREVEGLPDEALPTVKVVSRDGKMDEEEEVVEAVREAVKQAVEQAIEEAEVLEQASSEPAQDESAGDEEPLVEAQGQGTYASTEEEPVLQRDEL